MPYMHFLARFPMFCALLNVFIISFFTRVRDGFISDLVSTWGVCFGVRETRIFHIGAHSSECPQEFIPVQKLWLKTVVFMFLVTLTYILLFLSHIGHGALESPCEVS